MPRGVPLDLTGQQFNGWTVLAKIGRTEVGKIMWLCRCACGTEAAVPTGNLRGGSSKRCRACGRVQSIITRWGIR